MVQAKTFRDSSGKPVKLEEVEWREESGTKNQIPFHKTNQQQLTVTYEKMSKSKYNGVDPTNVGKFYFFIYYFIFFYYLFIFYLFIFFF